MLTNRKLSEKLNIPIGKIRRNTKEFLGEDPKATRRSGYEREFTINEGFFVYLGSVLVSKHGLTFGQARKAIEVIEPWLVMNQLVPEPLKKTGPVGIDAEIEEFSVTFTIYKGQIANLFEINGMKTNEILTKTENFGRTYDEYIVSLYDYRIKNNSGKIEYVEIGSGKLSKEENEIIEEGLLNFNARFEVDITKALTDFMYYVIGEERKKHPYVAKYLASLDEAGKL